MKKILLMLIVLLSANSFILFSSFKSANTAGYIEWISVEELTKLSENEPRKVLVNISTPWCESCRKMDATTFQDVGLSNYVNEKFYAVKFNAEDAEDLMFNGEQYNFNPNIGRRGVHNLALYLSNGRTVYPTIAILDEYLENPQPVFGYQDAKSMKMVLNYFGDDHYKTTEWTVFKELYNE